MSVRTVGGDVAYRERPPRTGPDGDGVLVAPAAVGLLELDEPLADLRLTQARSRVPYRSVLLVVRHEGTPLGLVALPVEQDGWISRDRLAVALLRHPSSDVGDALVRRELDLPSLLPEERRLAAPPVSVVVTTCRAPALLAPCLHSILASDYEDFEVIVVENRPGSPASRLMLADEFGDDPCVRYVEEPAPGLGSARNAGLMMAEGELVAFTDDDVVVDPGWIGRSAGAFERADDVACVTGLILPRQLETDSQLLLEEFMALGKGFESRTYRLPDSRATHPLLPYTPGVIGSGANTVLRADVARREGGFDPTLGTGTPAAGGEDLDLYIRLLRSGHAVAYEPGAIVWHAHPDGAAKLRHQAYRYGVSLGATLTKQLVAGPERLELVRAVPAGIRYVCDPASEKNASKAAGFPRRLEWLERLGMAVGPVAYLTSAVVGLSRQRPRPRRRTTAAGRVVYGQRLVLGGGQVVNVVEVAPERLRRAPHVRPWARPAATTPERALLATAAAACVAAPLLVAIAALPALRFAAVLAFFCLAPGMTLISLLPGRSELGLVLGASLAISAVLAQSMLWLGSWQPDAYFYALTAACFPFLAARLRISRRSRSPTVPERLRRAAAAAPTYAVAHGALLTTAAVLWAVALDGTQLRRIAGLGLLNALPPTYFLAFALLLVGFATAVSRDQLNPKLLAVYVLALIFVLHGTTPLVYDEPRYPWAYKHIAAIDLIGHSGAVDRRIDIYNNWPGFFAVNAWLSTVSGASPRAYAEWAQVFFNVANVAALRFALRGVTGDERLLWTATWIFLLGNWIGQDYLAPQAFAFFLSLVVLGLCLRCGPAPRRSRLRAARWWAASVQRFREAVRRQSAAGESLPPGPLSSRGALAVGVPCYLAIVVTHQLTPVMLLAAATGLAVCARRLPISILAAMLAVEAWWIALAWPYLTKHFLLFHFDPAASATPAGYHAGAGLPGLTLVENASWATVLLIAALALAGLVRRLRGGHWDAAAALLVITPAPVILAQAYSGEGRYRLFLFALPWLSFFAATACAPGSSRLSKAVPGWRLALAGAAVSLCLLPAYFGLELSNLVTRGDVAAAVWFDNHAPRDSLPVEVTADAISRINARYAYALDPSYVTSPTLTDKPGFRDRKLGRKDLPRIEKILRDYAAEHTFLMLTPSQRRFARLYGLLPSGWQRSLERTLERSTAFRLVYRSEGASIFEYQRPPTKGSAK